MYIYIKWDDVTWTVGFFDPSGEFIPESDWNTAEEAAHQVHYLNGGAQ